MVYGTSLDLSPVSYAAIPTAVGQGGTGTGMTKVTSHRVWRQGDVPCVTWPWSRGRYGGSRDRPPPFAGTHPASYAPGRTTPRIGIEPAPASVTVRPGRGAWTIVPSPTYIATWLASSK